MTSEASATTRQLPETGSSATAPTTPRSPDEAWFQASLAAARANERGGWEALHGLVAARMLGFLRVRAREDAEDLLGDAWVRIVRGIDGFEGTADGFIGWSLRISQSVVVDAHRRRGRRPVTEQLEPHHEPATIERTDPLDADAVALLSLIGEPHRSALYLHYALDLEVAHVAQVLGRSVAATKMLLMRARRQLRTTVDGGRR